MRHRGELPWRWALGLGEVLFWIGACLILAGIMVAVLALFNRGHY